MSTQSVDVLMVMNYAQSALQTAKFAASKARGERKAQYEQSERELQDARAAVAELIEAAHRVDGDERPSRPERGIGYTDDEWELFLAGWNAHAAAVFDSGLRKILTKIGSAS